MARQMDDNDRHLIEDKLRLGWLVAQIAQLLGRPESTVAREIKRRRIDSSKGARPTSSALCALFESCRRTKVCAVECGMRKLCKNCIACVEACADFIPRVCHRLVSSPFVCNGCEKERTCPLEMKFYIADVAQTNREGLLHESRRGIRATGEQIDRIDAVLSPCLRNGQSIRNVMANNPGSFDFCERTVYTYLCLRRFDAVRGDLPRPSSGIPTSRRRVTTPGRNGGTARLRSSSARGSSTAPSAMPATSYLGNGAEPGEMPRGRQRRILRWRAKGMARNCQPANN